MGCDSQGHPIVRIGSERPPIAEVGFAMFRFVAALRVLLSTAGNCAAHSVFSIDKGSKKAHRGDPSRVLKNAAR